MFYRHSVDGIWMSGWLISCRAIFANVDRALNLGFEDSCGDWFAIYFNGLRQAYTDSEQSHEMGILALTTMKKLELKTWFYYYLWCLEYHLDPVFSLFHD